jgi:hypothetical protein
MLVDGRWYLEIVPNEPIPRMPAARQQVLLHLLARAG